MNRLFSRLLSQLFLGFLLIPLANSASAQEVHRYINVTGSAEAKVAPDEVVINLGIETTHKNIRDALKQNDERLKKLIAVLEKQGIDPKHIQLGLIRVTPNHEDPQQHYGKGGKYPAQQMQMPQPAQMAPNANAPNAGDPFGQQATESSETRIKDYTASKSVVVYSKDLAKLEQVLVGIYESGVANVGGIVFQSSAVKKLRETLRPKAIQASREKAEVLTAAIGQKIGKAVRIEENSGNGPTYPSAYDPFGPSLPAPASFRYAPSDTTGGPAGIAPETITVSSSVTVWFELP